MRISVLFLLSGLLLCSCTHRKPPFQAKPYELPSYPPVTTTLPPRATPPAAAPTNAGGESGGSGSGSSSVGAAGGGGGGGGVGAGGSSQGSPGSTATPEPAAPPSETSAGTGHVAPLGDRSRTKPLAEEELRIVGTEEHGSRSATKPSTQPDTEAASAAKRPSPPAAPVPQVEVKPEDIERLPPERRAALLRYLKQIQAQRAATQPAEGQR